MTGIYSLPENPSAADIIERSIVAHPSLFREALIKQAEILCRETGPAVIALNVACKLQCLPSHIRTAAACTLDEGN